MDFFISRKKLFYILILVALAASAFGLSFLKLEFNFEQFFDKKDPDYQFYQYFQELFGDEYRYAYFVALNDPDRDLLDTTFLRQSRAIFEQIAAMDGIDSVVAATNFSIPLRSGLRIRKQDYLKFDTEREREKTRKRIFEDSLGVGVFVSRSMQYLCGFAFIDKARFNTPGRDEVTRNLRELLDQSPLQYQMSGIPSIRTDYVKLMAGEIPLYFGIFILAIGLVMSWIFRNWRIGLFSVLVVFVSIVLVFGLMGGIGASLNLVTILLIPILFIVGTSDIVHLFNHYHSALGTGQTYLEARNRSLRKVGTAIFITSLTSAIGFLSLGVSKIPPIQSFGFFTSIGVLLVWLVSVMGFIWLGSRPNLGLGSKKNSPDSSWSRWLGKLDRHIKARPLVVVLLFALPVPLLMLMIPRIPTNYILLDDIPKSNNLYKAKDFFEQELNGFYPFDLYVESKVDSIPVTDYQILVEIDKIESWLTQRLPLSPTVSPVSLIKQANYTYHFNNKRYLSLPGTAAESEDRWAEIYSFTDPTIIRRVIAEDGLSCRISARVQDVGSDTIASVINRLSLFMAQACNTNLIRVRPTGHVHITQQSHLEIRRTLIQSLGLAIGIIALILAVILRSGRIILTSLICNLLPLLWTAAIMGIFEINLSPSTSMAFLISFGIVVDDSIHFATRYLMNLQEDRSPSQAITHTLLHTGKSIIFTSIILMGGFLLLLFSSFKGIQMTGVLCAFTIFIALLSNLLLQPVLIGYLWKEPQ